MKVMLFENQSKKLIGELVLKTHPRNGEWIEFKQNNFSIHRIVHAVDSLKIMVIAIR